MKTNLKEFTLKDNGAFRIRIESWECAAPKDLYAINFHNECLNIDGEVDFRSTYNFFLTKEDINNLAQGLTK